MTGENPPDWSITALDAIDAEDALRLVERIKALPDLTRRVVTLRKAWGYSQEEIAVTLNITPEQVMGELVKAVQACADMDDINAEQ